MQDGNDAKITHAGPIYARTFSETKFSAVARFAIGGLCNVNDLDNGDRYAAANYRRVLRAPVIITLHVRELIAF